LGIKEELKPVELNALAGVSIVAALKTERDCSVIVAPKWWLFAFIWGT
jgi:hypothetical protein